MIVLEVADDERDGYAAALSAAGISPGPVAEVALADPDRIAGLDFSAVRWVQSTWAGVDRVDWDAVPEGVAVTTLPGVFGPQMAEFVLGHLLGRSQRIPERHAVRSWDPTPPGLLAGTTLGILGAGSIGEAVAGAAGAFGMVVVGCSRSGTPRAGFEEMWPVSRVEDFVRGLDHLVVVLPSTDETRGLVDARLLARLNHGATLVNVGRGSTVDTDAVVTAIDDGTLGLAVLDVTDPEPLPDDHPAWERDRIVVTGHTAALSRPVDVVEFLVGNLARHRSGEPLEGLVDRSAGY